MFPEPVSKPWNQTPLHQTSDIQLGASVKKTFSAGSVHVKTHSLLLSLFLIPLSLL